MNPRDRSNEEEDLPRKQRRCGQETAGIRKALELQVSLPSGRSETVSVLQSGSVADLKIAAQRSLGQRFLRLVAPDGRLLLPTESLQFSGLHDGNSITAFAQQPKIAGTMFAFALIGLSHGVKLHTVVTALQSKIRSGTFSRFLLMIGLLLRSWQMDP